MSWIDNSCNTFEEVFSLRENLYRDYQSFAQVFVSEGLLEERLMQLCQQRCEQLHRSGHSVSGLDKDLLEALPQWYNSPLFSPLEKAALQLAPLKQRVFHRVTMATFWCPLRAKS